MTSHDRRRGMLARMHEATRLTRGGRLRDATSLIQQTLRGQHDGEPVDVQSAAHTGPPPPTRVASTVLRTARTSSDTAHTPRPDAATAGAGRFAAESLTTRAGRRSYKVYVPSSASRAAMPLLVMLHGCTQNADDFAAGTRMNVLAEGHGLVVVYPEQASKANPNRCWNWFEPADQRRDRGEPSLIADITRTVMASAHVDPARVHIAGMSAGGAMAATLGAVYPDLFTAVGVHSGLAHGAATDLPSAFQAMRSGGSDAIAAGPGVPTIVFHGDRDTTVHHRNADQVLRQATAQVPQPLVTVHDEAGAAGRGATRQVYRTADGRTVAEGWSVHGLGHAWSGGDPTGSHTDPAGPDASGQMLRFFDEHSRHA